MTRPLMKMERLAKEPAITQPVSTWLEVPSRTLVFDNFSINNKHETCQASLTALKAFKNSGDEFSVKCSLRFYKKAVKGHEPELLHQTSQIGRLVSATTEEGEDSADLRLMFPKPYLVEDHHLMTNVKDATSPQKSGSSETTKWSLMESYRMRVTLEMAGNKTWSQLGLSSHSICQSGDAVNGDCCSSHLSKIFAPATIHMSEQTTGRIHNLRLSTTDDTLAKSNPIVTGYRLRVKSNQTDDTVTEQPPYVSWTHVKPQGDSTNIDVKGFACLVCHQEASTKDALEDHVMADHRQFRFVFTESERRWAIMYQFLDVDTMDDVQNTLVSQELIDLRSPESDEAASLLYANGAHESFIGQNTDQNEMGDVGVMNHDPMDIIQHTHHTTAAFQTDPPDDLDSFQRALLAAKQPPRILTALDKKVFTSPSFFSLGLLPPTTVPETLRPLFHTETRSILKPSTPRRPPWTRPAEEWRLQEHRDIINDFSDFTDDEKEFYIRWDTFMALQHVTANVYLPRALYRFINVNTEMDERGMCWLNEKEARRELFALLLTALQLRGAISMDVLVLCSKLLEQAGNEIRPREAETKIKPSSSARGKVANGGQRRSGECSCGIVIPPFGAMICTGPTCKSRFHHATCVGLEEDAWKVQRKWLCESCASMAGLRRFDDVLGDSHPSNSRLTD